VIDPSARLEQPCIVKDVTIGARSIVWEFAKVIRGAIVGDDCSIGGCAIVDAAHIGHRCSVGHGAQIHPGTRIRDDVFVGPGAIICNDRWPRVDKDGFNSAALLNGKFVTVEIHDGVNIGAGAIILPGVIIGAACTIAAGAVVTHSMPPCSLWKREGGWVPMMARRPERMRVAGSERIDA
jgi:UDP-2-acetamido-3-amino-2,3-dideoxy-glucuronate N-acetyltransferase